MQELAAAVGIGERTLRSIERDERPDPRTVGLVEAYLGLDTPVSQGSPGPSLAQATDAELAVEILRRLQAAGAERDDAPLPDEVRAEPDLLIAPPDDDDAADEPVGS